MQLPWRLSLHIRLRAGVAIPQATGNPVRFRIKKFDNPGDSHAGVRTGSEWYGLSTRTKKHHPFEPNQ